MPMMISTAWPNAWLPLITQGDQEEIEEALEIILEVTSGDVIVVMEIPEGEGAIVEGATILEGVDVQTMSHMVNVFYVINMDIGFLNAFIILSERKKGPINPDPKLDLQAIPLPTQMNNKQLEH